MNTAQIRCFLAVADTLNFARAAEQLHLTQPAVTHQIQTLEQELGVKLFARTTRTVRLTEEGGLFLADARGLDALAARAQRRFSGGGAVAERLRLGVLNSYCMGMLVPPLAALRAQRPALHPQLQLVPFRHIYALLDDGTLDAVVDLRIPDAPAGRFGYRELARLPFACLCAPGSPLAARAQVSAADLAAEPLALLAPYAAPPAVQRVQETLLGEHDPDTLHLCDSTEALTALVAAGYGAAVLPLPQGPAQPPLARVPFAGAVPVSFGAYYKTTRDRPQLKAFLAAARDVFAPGGTPPAAKGV